MNKNSMTIPDDLLGQLSKVFVTERLGINPEQHRLTTEAAWIHLAERLMRTTRIEKQATRQQTQKVR